MDYCISTWDPRRVGSIEEPHHNTYDIEFWGPDGMHNSFYYGALSAFIRMSEFLDKDVTEYKKLLKKDENLLKQACLMVSILSKDRVEGIECKRSDCCTKFP